jgi:hypothetical protein
MCGDCVEYSLPRYQFMNFLSAFKPKKINIKIYRLVDLIFVFKTANQSYNHEKFLYKFRCQQRKNAKLSLRPNNTMCKFVTVDRVKIFRSSKLKHLYFVELHMLNFFYGLHLLPKTAYTGFLSMKISTPTTALKINTLP